MDNFPFKAKDANPKYFSPEVSDSEEDTVDHDLKDTQHTYHEGLYKCMICPNTTEHFEIAYDHFLFEYKSFTHVEKILYDSNKILEFNRKKVIQLEEEIKIKQLPKKGKYMAYITKAIKQKLQRQIKIIEEIPDIDWEGSLNLYNKRSSLIKKIADLSLDLDLILTSDIEY